MNFHVQILETQFINLYHGLNLVRQGVMIPISATFAARYGEIPDFKVEQAIDQVGGMVAVCSPPPLQQNGHLPGNPVPKGYAHITLTRLCEMEKKEISMVNCKGSRVQKRAGVALKEENETDS